MKSPQVICVRDRASRVFLLTLLVASMSLSGSDRSWAQTPADAGPVAADSGSSNTEAIDAVDQTLADDVIPSSSEEGLWFAFRATPWRDVLDWIADESGLALHVNEIPTGSFTYTDPRSFTPEAALDRINLFLLPEGFTLVRSGSLLSLINLGDPRSMQQLDAIAELVSLDSLSERPSHEVVKCLFSLGDLTADEAVTELTGLQLMTEPAVFAKTNQIMITDTASKLRSAKSILDAFTSDTLDNGTVVKGFTLQHVDAEDVLAVARPHLGLATGEMIGIDVSISADVFGKSIFVTGIEDKVKLIEDLISEIDRPGAAMDVTAADAVLQSHAVAGGNLDMVYDVLQTLLAGQSVRLSKDREADTIVALAPASTQAHIVATVEQLQAREPDFEVIPLENVDPFYAIGLLQEMLDLPDALDDPDDVDPDAPKVDADPGNMRLYVRGRPNQIEQIRRIVEGLDQRAAGQASADVRVVPMPSQSAQQTLEAAAKFWNEPSPVLLFRGAGGKGQMKTERVVSEPSRAARLPRKNADVGPGKTIEASRAREPEPVAKKRPSELTPAKLDDGARLRPVMNPFRPSEDEPTDASEARVLTSNRAPEKSPIRVQVTPRGVVMQSDDLDALGRFEEHLREIAGATELQPSPPIVFYLKYTKAAEAIRMLAELLDGGEAAREGEAGTLINGAVGSYSGGSYLGSIVTSRQGTITMMAGSITVVADPRLNRLIAQGTASDIEVIEGYLKIIDRDKSLTEVETEGASTVIELKHTQASEVADVLRDAFAGQVVESSSKSKGSEASPAQSAAAAKAAAAAAAKAKAKASEGGSSNGQGAVSEPKMTIAVHEASNSLIVTGPPQLFARAKRLAEMVDQRGEQTIQILSPADPLVVESALLRLMGEEPSRARSSSSRDSSRSKSSR